MNYTYQCDTVGILPAVYVFMGNDSYACVQSELDRAQSADSWYTVSVKCTFRSVREEVAFTLQLPAVCVEFCGYN